MAFGKNSRMDRRSSSSSYCSTVTLVVFVALCLVGVWMMTSSVVVPIDVSTPDNKSDVKEEVTQTDKPFEDSSGDVQEEVMKVGSRTSVSESQEETNTETSQEQSLMERPSENQTEETQQGNSLKENEEAKNGPDGASEAKNGSDEGSQTYSDTNGNEGGDTNKEGGQGDGQNKSMEQSTEESGNAEQNSDESTDNGQKQAENENKLDGGENSEELQDENNQARIEEKVEKKQDSEGMSNSEETKTDDKPKDQNSNEVFPDGAQSEILNETSTQNGAWSTQAAESKSEKEAQKSSSSGQVYSWKLCNVTAQADYIPCLDNEEAIKRLHSTKHYEHRERHCPEEGPTCLVPLPKEYRQPIKWPNSRDKIWYHNVPHTKLAVLKGHQNWVKVTGEYLTFPGGGTQFKHGALHYIDFLQESLPDIAWGKRSRVILDVGCGVASFGGYLFERDVLAMSFAPKDEHEAQVQFALERGIPAISAVMGTMRLPFPSKVFDIVHCARCRVPWHIEGGTLLLELNRLLRPGGYFVWSATPVYQKIPEDVGIWKAMSELTKSMCWDLVTIKKDTLNGVGVAVYRKPSTNECYENRKENNPPVCENSDDPDAAWNIQLQACMHKVPEDPAVRGSQWPQQWPKRLEAVPYWLNSSQVGVYGKAAPEDFVADYEHWKHVVSKSYLNGMGIDWSNVRNVMDMRAIYGGFAAALRDVNVWVMNIVSIDSPDTLPIIYERGLFGMYHDWCQSFSTYPRSYDLLHADHLFSKIKKRCKLPPVIAEVDRMLRPEGKLIVRDNVETVTEVENMARSLQWEIRLTYSKENEGLLCVQKTMWRPQEVE